MIQRRYRTGLAKQSFLRFCIVHLAGQQKLQRDGALEPHVFRAIDDSHSPRAERFVYLEMREGFAGVAERIIECGQLRAECSFEWSELRRGDGVTGKKRLDRGTELRVLAA